MKGNVGKKDLKYQDLLPDFGKVRVFGLGMEDSSEIDTFLKECDDFSELVEGRPYQEADVMGLLLECPPEVDVKNKLVLAMVNSKDQIMGILDLVKDYPKKPIWFIGLLLIGPKFRDQGFGSQIINEIEKKAVNEGVKEIRLGVVEENRSAILFWQKNRYKIIIVRPPAKFGNKEHRVMIFQKMLI